MNNELTTARRVLNLCGKKCRHFHIWVLVKNVSLFGIKNQHQIRCTRCGHQNIVNLYNKNIKSMMEELRLLQPFIKIINFNEILPKDIQHPVKDVWNKVFFALNVESQEKLNFGNISNED